MNPLDSERIKPTSDQETVIGKILVIVGILLLIVGTTLMIASIFSEISLLDSIIVIGLGTIAIGLDVAIASMAKVERSLVEIKAAQMGSDNDEIN